MPLIGCQPSPLLQTHETCLDCVDMFLVAAEGRKMTRIANHCDGCFMYTSVEYWRLLMPAVVIY